MRSLVCKKSSPMHGIRTTLTGLGSPCMLDAYTPTAAADTHDISGSSRSHMLLVEYFNDRTLLEHGL